MVQQVSASEGYMLGPQGGKNKRGTPTCPGHVQRKGGRETLQPVAEQAPQLLQALRVQPGAVQAQHQLNCNLQAVQWLFSLCLSLAAVAFVSAAMRSLGEPGPQAYGWLRRRVQAVGCSMQRVCIALWKDPQAGTAKLGQDSIEACSWQVHLAKSACSKCASDLKAAPQAAASLQIQQP